MSNDIRGNRYERVSALFEQWEETILWSCLQKVMGKIYADDLIEPTTAIAMLGNFIFFSRRTQYGLLIISARTFSGDFMILVPRDEHWTNIIMDFYGQKAKIFPLRDKRNQIFLIGKLEKLFLLYRKNTKLL